MMKVLSWIRSYYLYFYYTSALNPINGKRMPSRGFIYTVGLVMINPALIIMGGVNYLYPFINDGMREELFVFRGSINYLVLTMFSLAIILTYLVCCFKIRFEEIAPRLEEIPFFAQRSIPKYLLLMLINFVITIICMILLYK